MGLHRKWEALVGLEPDIAVVAECARPEIVERKLGRSLETQDALWVGRQDQKGLAVFSFGPWSAHLDSGHTADIEFVAPVRVAGPNQFLLLAVWAMNHRALHTPPGTKPGRQVQLALERFLTVDDDNRVIVAGDFNTNMIWSDRKPRPFTMADCVDELQQRKLVSAYHRSRGVAFGNESEPSHFRVRGGTVKAYHIDYIWLPEAWRVDQVDVGFQSEWYDTKLSDHAPLSAKIEIPPI